MHVEIFRRLCQALHMCYFIRGKILSLMTGWLKNDDDDDNNDDDDDNDDGLMMS